MFNSKRKVIFPFTNVPSSILTTVTGDNISIYINISLLILSNFYKSLIFAWVLLWQYLIFFPRSRKKAIAHNISTYFKEQNNLEAITNSVYLVPIGFSGDRESSTKRRFMSFLCPCSFPSKLSKGTHVSSLATTVFLAMHVALHNSEVKTVDSHSVHINN